MMPLMMILHKIIVIHVERPVDLRTIVVHVAIHVMRLIVGLTVGHMVRHTVDLKVDLNVHLNVHLIKTIRIAKCQICRSTSERIQFLVLVVH